MSDLNDFLKGDAEPAPDALEELIGVRMEADAPAPKPEAKPEPETAEAEPEGEEDPRRMIPAAVMHAERRERQDWKEKAVRAETERDALRQQLEEAKRGPAVQQHAPQPDQQQRSPEEQRIFDEVNARLNFSEMAARDKHGDEVIDQAVEEFKRAVAINPSLATALHTQVHPYAWLVKQAENFKAKREIGDDPAAYKAKLEAEFRAKWEAEQGAPAPRVSPAAGLAPSLANARSAASRSAPTFTGPTALEDLFPTR